MFLTLFTEEALEEDVISGVAFEPRICDISNDRDQPNSKIDSHVSVHLTHLHIQFSVSTREGTMWLGRPTFRHVCMRWYAKNMSIRSPTIGIMPITADQPNLKLQQQQGSDRSATSTSFFNSVNPNDKPGFELSSESLRHVRKGPAEAPLFWASSSSPTR